MSTNVSFTWAPAEPGCCPSTCQQILDMVQAAVSGTVNITGIVIGPTTPVVNDRDKVWMVTTDDTNCTFNGIRVWCTTSGTWVDFVFSPSTITAGDECTFLGTLNGIVGHRTIAELIDCIGDKQIPCSKINFGVVPDGCTYNTWQITIQANSDSIAAGRIEFELSWTSATCGVGNLFVTWSPIVIGQNYTLNVCMPSDAVQTVTNLKGTAIGGWSNTTVQCDPPSCSTTSGSGLVLEITYGPFAIPETAGGASGIIQSHPFGSNIISANTFFKCTTVNANYPTGKKVWYMDVREKDGQCFYAMTWDDTNIVFFQGNQDPTNDVCIVDFSNGDNNATFTPASWSAYITVLYRQ
jgi:hypothetical protein